MIPKCTHWMGHKFEPRFSYSVPDNVNIGEGRLSLETTGNVAIIEAFTRRYQHKTYHHDVCVRCGATVKLVPRKKATEAEESPE